MVHGLETIKKLNEAASIPPPLALDVSLEKARALHRVWRALNDGDCPKCHRHHAAHVMVRSPEAIQCPWCGFNVTHQEIEEIEKLFAPAMDAAVGIFEEWRRSRGPIESKKPFEEFRKEIRELGGDAWDNYNVDEKLKEIRGE